MNFLHATKGRNEDTMIRFKNDYSEGAHPRLLQALITHNLSQEEGYGLDSHCLAAAIHIKKQLNDESVDIHFIPGGTQTNLVAISAFLRPHEAVISPVTGHIVVHETGAIEQTGHKVVTVPSADGRLTTADIEAVLTAHTDEHMVKPRLVYISNPTEVGTVYSRTQLEAISAYCKKHDLYLYADGARIGSAVTAVDSGITLSDMCALTDAFFIGGTKNGALLGEALVIRNPLLKSDFRYGIKQKGALLAKGRLMGIQFEEMFKDGLFFEMAEHANHMAQRIRDALKAKGFPFLVETITNQIFPILGNEQIQLLQKEFDFYTWAPVDDTHSSVRLVTSWATSDADAALLCKRILALE